MYCMRLLMKITENDQTRKLIYRAMQKPYSIKNIYPKGDNQTIQFMKLQMKLETMLSSLKKKVVRQIFFC